MQRKVRCRLNLSCCDVSQLSVAEQRSQTSSVVLRQCVQRYCFLGNIVATHTSNVLSSLSHEPPNIIYIWAVTHLHVQWSNPHVGSPLGHTIQVHACPWPLGPFGASRRDDVNTPHGGSWGKGIRQGVMNRPKQPYAGNRSNRFGSALRARTTKNSVTFDKST